MSKCGFAASLALARYLKDSLGIDARVKWPNDVWLAGKAVWHAQQDGYCE